MGGRKPVGGEARPAEKCRGARGLEKQLEPDGSNRGKPESAVDAY